jgi:hypothetical protein
MLEPTPSLADHKCKPVRRVTIATKKTLARSNTQCHLARTRAGLRWVRAARARDLPSIDCR